MLKLTNITKDYKVASSYVHALKGVSLEFRSNEFVCILGQSGCGKTTLLNIIGGLDHYTSGDLVIQGKSTKDFKDRDWDVYRNHRIGFVFQTYNLIPHQTVLSNVELALTIAGVGKEERRRRAKQALERVGLGEELSKRPNQLSGGQMQRVAIARALVNDPDILLADEPTGALDSKTSVAIMDLIKEIAGERLVIMVTHNPELAESYASRIVRLKDGVVESDSNPYNSDEETQNEAPMSEDMPFETPSVQPSSEELPAEETPQRPAKKARAKMGFLTALALSFRNLLTKKGRTLITSIGGSIGIISVCLVLALSNGFGNYIRKTEEDMLSAYPIQISESALDINAVMDGFMSPKEMPDLDKLGDKVYINSFLTGLAQGITIQNKITPEYIDYLEKGKKESPDDFGAIQYSYGLNYSDAIFTQMETSNGGKFYFVKDGEYDTANSLQLNPDPKTAIETNPDITTGTWVMSLTEDASAPAAITQMTGSYEYNSKTSRFVLYSSEKQTEENEYALGTRTTGDTRETISVTTVDGEERSFTFCRDKFLTRYFSVNALKEYLQNKLIAEAPVYESLLRFVPLFTNVINRMPGTSDFSDPDYAKYVASQYDIVNKDGHLPTNEHEAVMVIGPNNDVIDLTLVQLGFLDEEQFLDLFRDAQATEEGVETLSEATTTVSEGGETLSPSEAKKRLAFDRILQQQYILFYNDAIYTKNEDYKGFTSSLNGEYPFKYVQGEYDDKLEGEISEETFAAANQDEKDAQGIDFKITAILRLKDGLSYGCLEDGLNLPEATVDKLIEHNMQSEIVKWLQSDQAKVPGLSGATDGVTITLSPASHLNIKTESDGKYYRAVELGDMRSRVVKILGGNMMDRFDAGLLGSGISVPADGLYSKLIVESATATLQATFDLSVPGKGAEMTNKIMERVKATQGDTIAKDTLIDIFGDVFVEYTVENPNIRVSYTTDSVIRYLGGNDEPSGISIYPTGFDAKQRIKNYLDDWNDTVESRNAAWLAEHPGEEGHFESITYTDQMGMIMNMVETIFNLISYVLVAFTAISLVVSSVMIGIITYVSVVERVKEIGVLRSLGARKMDIRNLFNSETFMIGLASGIIGVVIAYILSGIVSAVLFSLTGIAGMASLAPLTAFIMICVSVGLTLISGLIPASAAAKKDPVIALRTE